MSVMVIVASMFFRTAETAAAVTTKK